MGDPMKKKINARFLLHLCLSLFFLLCVIAPIIAMFLRITPQGFAQVLHSAQFLPALRNSVAAALTATLISLALSMPAAWCLERTAIRGKAFFGMVFIIPMLIPSISHAFGLVALFGANGALTNFFHWNGSIYGFWGIVAGSVMYSFPVSFLMFSSILQYEDGSPYMAAQVLGVPAWNQFTDITLPYLRKTFISAFFAVFTMVITDYGVPLMVGGKTITLSVLMYNKAVAMVDYDSGSVIGAFLLVPAVIAFLVDLFNPDNAQNSFTVEAIRPAANKLRDLLAYAFCTVVSLGVFAPIVAFCGMVFETKYPVDPQFTLHHIQSTLQKGADQYLTNSILCALATAVLGTLLAFVCAYLTTRVQGPFRRWLHLVAITSMAIPGLVLGLSYVIFFNGTPLYGTFLILVLVDTIHFFASPYLMMYNTLGKVNPNLEAVGQSLGVSRVHIILDVILPKVLGTLLEMFSYFFVNAMMTISAVSFLAPPAPKVVALMINQFEAQLLMESAAFVSLLILFVNLIVKLGITLFCRRRTA